MSHQVVLSEDGELSLQAYLRFSKLKRDQHVREACAVISEFKNDKLQPGEMYNYRDLCELFADMEDAMRSLVDKEVQHAYHTNALLVKILLSQAYVNGMELLVDTNQLENEFLLQTIAKSEATALSRPPSDFVKRNTNLGRLGHVATVGVADPKLIKANEELQQELRAMQERMQKLQEQTTQQMRDRTGSNDQMNHLRDELAAKDEEIAALRRGQGNMLDKMKDDFNSLSMQAKGAAQVSQSQFDDMERQLNQFKAEADRARRDLAQAQHELNVRERELREANDGFEGRLMDSKQFQQLKKMMQQKSTEVVALRKRLNKYEPQSVPDADADHHGHDF